MKNTFFAAIIITLLMPAIAQSGDRPKTISVDEAEKLVLATIPSKTRHLPKFGLDQYQDPNSKDYYFFVALWQGAPNGSAVIGHYAVDPSTGDVWGATAECDKKGTPALRKLQAKIRAQLGLSNIEYQKIKKKGPLCEE